MAQLVGIEQEYTQACDSAHRYWGSYYKEAERDMQFSVGKQWNAQLEAYLKAQGRSALVFDKSKRIIRLITGYQRKNRLALKIDAGETGSEETASVFSATAMRVMSLCHGYNVMSDAFKFGALISGLNLVEIDVCYDFDPVNGDIVLHRKPYNRFLMDPNIQRKDFKDLDFLIPRDYLTEDQIKRVCPVDINLKDVKPPSGDDSHFPYFRASQSRRGKDLHKYDRFFVSTSSKRTILVNRRPQPGEKRMQEWKGTAAQLTRFFQAVDPTQERFAKLERWDKDVELRIVINGEPVWKGPEPTGIRDFPFVPVWGFFTPEYPDADRRVQGLMRCMRDPQDEINQRRSKMLDIIDSQITSGWIAREDAVKNKDQLYQSGQGNVVYINDAVKEPIEQVIKKQSAADIPAGMFQLTELFDRDIIEIPGANNEMFGSPDNDDIEVAALLAKLRSSNGVVGMQDMFDDYRMSKSLLGDKIIAAIQANFKHEKIMRLTGKEPTQEFYDRHIGKYSCVPVEGVLTDTQKQQYFTQLYAFKKEGAPIPWAEILRVWPVEDKKSLIEAVQKAEQQAAQQNAENQQLNRSQNELSQSMMRANYAKEQERLTQANENKAGAQLDRMKSLKEARNLDTANLADLVRMVLEVQSAMNPQQQAAK